MRRYLHGYHTGKYDFWQGEPDPFQWLTPFGRWLLSWWFVIIYFPACGEAFVQVPRWRHRLCVRLGRHQPSAREAADMAAGRRRQTIIWGRR